MAVFSPITAKHLMAGLNMNEAFPKSSSNLMVSESIKVASMNENNLVDENVLLDWLSSASPASHQKQALQYIDKYLNEKQNIIVSLLEQDGLFAEFNQILQNQGNTTLQIQCTKLIGKLIPNMDSDLDSSMLKVIPSIVSNIGNQAIMLQKESMQALHIYMKHSADIDQVLKSLAYDGIQHKNQRTRQQVIFSLPLLLFADFKSEDFFDIVFTLATNLTEKVVPNDLVLKTLHKVKDLIGASAYMRTVEKLPLPLKMTLNKLDVSDNEKLDTSQSSRAGSEGKRKRLDLNSKGNMRNSSNFQHSNSMGSLPVGKADILRTSSIFKLGFISKEVVENLSNPKAQIRLAAVKEFAKKLDDINDPTELKQNVIPMISLLQPIMADKNYRMVCFSIMILQKLIEKLGPNTKDFTSLFISAIASQIGLSNTKIRSECLKAYISIMRKTEPLSVLDLLWPKLQNPRAQVREDIVNLVTASLLILEIQEKSKVMNKAKLCNRLAKLLLDKNPDVRRQTLECFAVIGHILGSDQYPITNSINQVELLSDNASGVMSAVHARLIRKQLPRLSNSFVVEPAVTSSNSSQSADLQWISAAAGISKQQRAENNRMSSSSFSSSHPSPQSKSDTYRYSNSAEPQKNKPKAAFPWSADDSGRHPSSAPVKV